MKGRGAKQRALLTFLAVVSIVGLTSVAERALAAGTSIPHGGYATTTDACLQCHDIHESVADLGLLRRATLTAVCNTCHSVYLAGPAGPYDPGYGGSEAGSRPAPSVYRVPLAAALTHDGHRLGLGGGQYLFADGASRPGDYIPGSSTRLTVLVDRATHETTSAVALSSANGLYCASCHTPHGEWGAMLGPGVNPNLLRSRPNNVVTTVTVAPGSWATQGGLWCVGCHDQRQSNHPAGEPDTIGNCFTPACHGDASGVVHPHEGSVTYR